MTDDDVARAVAAALGGRRVATAESCTAGRVVAALAGVEGAAEFLRGGVVAYAEGVKRSLLGVRAASVYTEDAVSEMAAAACRVLGADAAVATSGVVGGDPVDGVRAGTVFIGTSVGGRHSGSTHRFDGTPEQVCDAACRRALLDLLDAVRDEVGDRLATPNQAAHPTEAIGIDGGACRIGSACTVNDAHQGPCGRGCGSR